MPQITRNFVVVENVLNFVQKPIDIAYDERRGVQTNYTVSWTQLPYITKSVNFNFDIARVIQKDFICAFEFSLLGSIHKELDVKYAIIRSAYKYFDVVFDVHLEETKKSLIVNYAIEKMVALQVPVPITIEPQYGEVTSENTHLFSTNRIYIV